MMELQKDKYGIPVYPDVAYINQRGEVAVKRWNPAAGWNRTEHLLACAHYTLQGAEILKKTEAELHDARPTEGHPDTYMVAKLCHKAAIAFSEGDNAAMLYAKKYNRRKP